MTFTGWVALACLTLYALFLWWYGGRGKPLTETEKTQILLKLEARLTQRRNTQGEDPTHGNLLDQARALLAKDDGREFIMHNVVKYRSQAIYPESFAQAGFSNDPRKADALYGKAIIPLLLKYASVPVFIAPKTGSFIDYEGAPQWSYVAMVRYRSRRDFFKFAMDVERINADVHKWDCIAQTQVYPVTPLVSFIFVRLTVGVLIAAVGGLICL